MSVSKRFVNLPTEFAAIGYSEIVLRGFKVFVSKPCLNGAQWDAVLLPTGRARLAKSVQVDVLAYRVRSACHFG